MSGTAGAPALLVDARYLDSGIGRITRHMARAVGEAWPGDHAFILRREADREVIEKETGSEARVYRYIDAPMYSLAEQRGLSGLDSRPVLVTCHYVVPYFHRGRIVSTVLDLAHLDLPGIFRSNIRRSAARMMIKKALTGSAAVMTISEFTRGRISHHFGERFDRKITTVYAPVSKLGPTAPDSPVDGEFVLYVGNLKPHKNLGTLREAFLLFKGSGRHDGLKLVIAGGGDFRGASLERGLSGKDVILTGPLGDAELGRYYSHCRCLVSASLYEGFGIPPVEAMHHGRPVAVSDIPVFREILGEEAVYFDPRSVESIASALEKALSEPAGAPPTDLLEKYSHESFSRRVSGVIGSVLGSG